MTDLTHARVRELLDYDPETGIVTWLVNRGSRGRAGHVAGAVHDGRYARLMVDGQSYKAHRLVWFWMTGKWPYPRCDHIDQDKSNNKWVNLREATISQNGANRGLAKNNTSGVKGVNWNSKAKKWQANIKVNGVEKHLGLFSDIETAKAIREAAFCAAFGEYAA